MLVAALIVLACLVLGVIELADEVKEGATRGVDEWILLSLRRADDRAVPIGPAWLREAGLDLTALGSPVVLILTVNAVIGLMWLQRQYGLALFTLLTTISGSAIAALLTEYLSYLSPLARRRRQLRQLKAVDTPPHRILP